MGFEARLSVLIFFLLTFAILCSGRKIPAGDEIIWGTEDYDGPGANPRHDPHPSPAMPVSTSLPRKELKTQNHLPAAKKSSGCIVQKDTATP